MNLASFIETRTEQILSEWESFAVSLGAITEKMNSEELRDHAHKMLDAIAADMRLEQSPNEQAEKGKGRGLRAVNRLTAASIHGAGRHHDGFHLLQLTAEFRALRSSVLRLWLPTIAPTESGSIDDLVRFNEALDQAIAESISMFTEKADQARDVFLAMLGHDLRSPLQAIGLTVAHFEREDLDPSRRITSVTRIKRSVASMTSMVNDLLEFSRLQLGGAMPVKRKSAGVVALCGRAIGDARLARPGATIHLIAPAPIVAEVDEERLLQMLSNLLNNACQYATRGTAITLTAREVDAAIFLEVHNFGPAIPLDALEGVFDPLVQLEVDLDVVDRPRASMGLGLFIARRIAEAHGGQITVGSGTSTGTTFSVRLPRS